LQTMTQRRERGAQAERAAAEYLHQRGYRIVETNWRCRQGEIDIIARHGETLVFVEVRARSGGATAAAFESVGPVKQERLARLAHAYLSEHELEDANWRVDIVAVGLRPSAPPLIEHAENALDW